MGLLEICLFSEVNAVVTLNGKPASGIEVTRTAIWNNKTFSDKSTTDAQGHLHFKPLLTNSFMKITPTSPVIQQTMLVNHQGKELTLWEIIRQNYDLNGERDDDKSIILTCELSEPTVKHDQNMRAPMYGICKW